LGKETLTLSFSTALFKIEIAFSTSPFTCQRKINIIHVHNYAMQPPKRRFLPHVSISTHCSKKKTKYTGLLMA
jgi:hypothetical protein